MPTTAEVKQHCMGGCGKIVDNQWGRCLLCRKVTCQRCGQKKATYPATKCKNCLKADKRKLSFWGD